MVLWGEENKSLSDSMPINYTVTNSGKITQQETIIKTSVYLH